MAASSSAPTAQTPTLSRADAVLDQCVQNGNGGYIAYFRDVKDFDDSTIAEILADSRFGKVFESLSMLILSNTKVTDAGLSMLARVCRSLNYVSLNGCVNVTGPGVVALVSTNPSDIYKLDLANTRCNDATMFELCRLHRPVNDLQLSGTLVGDAGLRAAAVSFAGQLKQLSVPTLCTGPALVEALSAMTKLRYLTLDATAITNRDLVMAIENVGSTVTHLTLKNLRVDDDALVGISKRLPKLRSFYIDNCVLVSDRGLSHILRHCGGTLYTVSVRQCVRVTDLIVECAAMHFRKCKYSCWLRLEGLPLITGEAITLITASKRCRMNLEVNDCCQVSQTVADAAQKVVHLRHQKQAKKSLAKRPIRVPDQDEDEDEDDEDEDDEDDDEDKKKTSDDSSPRPLKRARTSADAPSSN